MDDFLEQVQAAANDGQFYFLALAGALAIPDICCALGADDSEAWGPHYIAWFDGLVRPLCAPEPRFPPSYPPPLRGFEDLTGEDCYRFRCVFLHQARTQDPLSSYSRILFVEPGGAPHGHMVKIGDALHIDSQALCNEMAYAARQWVKAQAGNETVERNLANSVRRYPEGLAPYLIGAPVISWAPWPHHGRT
jgi:hypothetical protein